MKTGIFSRAARGPHGVEIRIVELQPCAVSLLRAETEAFADLTNADRAGFDVRLELRDGLLRPAGPDALEADAGQHAHPILVRTVAHDVQRALQPLAGHIVGAEGELHADAVELLHERRERLLRREHAGDVRVVIHRAVLGLGYRMRRGHHGRARTVVDDRRGGKLGRAAVVGAPLSHPRRAFLPGLDRHAAAAAAAASAASLWQTRGSTARGRTSAGRRRRCGLLGPRLNDDERTQEKTKKDRGW